MADVGKIVLVLIFFMTVLTGRSQEIDEVKYESGKSLFSTYCGTCHGVHREMAGPMLASITKKRPERWLLDFIKNSQNVIISGDEYAKDLFQQYNQVVMPAFEYLSDTEIKSILYFIEVESKIPTEHAILEFPAFELDYEGEGKHIKGRELFEQQCYPCHRVDYEEKAPALGSITKRRPISWLLTFIKNPQETIASSDGYAQYIGKQHSIEMIPFKHLNDEEILEILNYIEYESSSAPPIAGVNGRKLKKYGKYTPLGKDVEFKKETVLTVFIIISLFGASVHLYLMIRLFFYLYKKKYK